MGATNKTANLELPLFVGTDKPSWLGDFNGAMTSIDAGYGKQSGDISAAATAAQTAKTTADAAQEASAANTTSIQQLTGEMSDVMGDIASIEVDVSKIKQDISNGLQLQLTRINGDRYMNNAWFTNSIILFYAECSNGLLCFISGGRIDTLAASNVFFGYRFPGQLPLVTQYTPPTNALASMPASPLVSKYMVVNSSNSTVTNVTEVYCYYNAQTNYTYFGGIMGGTSRDLLVTTAFITTPSATSITGYTPA